MNKKIRMACLMVVSGCLLWHSFFQIEAADKKENQYCVIDCSKVEEGFVKVQYTKQTKKRLKARVTGPDHVVYTYDLKQGKTEVFPLSAGNGSYQVNVYQNISGKSYAQVIAHSFTVKMNDKFGPFLKPNQFVNYTSKSKVVKKAKTLTKGEKDPVEKVKKIYEYVTENFKYDKKKAATVQSGYLPNVDLVLKEKKGICFDYAAVMAAMLRSRNVPTKMVVGYCGTAYHAWLNIYTEESGWVDGMVFFNGKTWKLIDPTLASSAQSRKAIKKYIEDPSHYKAKYLY